MIKKRKSLLEALWEYKKDKCEHRCKEAVRLPDTKDHQCPCAYFPKYVYDKKGKSHYGKAYLELGDKINGLCECKRKAWWKKRIKIRTIKTCPTMDFLKQLHGLGGGKYYKEFPPWDMRRRKKGKI